MDQFRDEIAEKPWRITDDDVEAAAVENAAPPADLPSHAAAATNGDDEVAVVTNLDLAGTEQICTEALTLLQERVHLPSRFRDRTMVRCAQQFLHKVQEEESWG